MEFSGSNSGVPAATPPEGTHRPTDPRKLAELTESALIGFVSGLPGVVTTTASEATGAPEVAWGDSFFFYHPEGDPPLDHRAMFATIVTKDYPEFDTASELNRPGVFRLNIAVGRARFQELIGYPPAAHAEHHQRFDYRATDRLLPHPLYAIQGWVAVLNPGRATAERARSALTHAHARAAKRHRPRRGEPGR